MANSPLDDYDNVGRTFLQALGTGSHGCMAAYRVFQIFPRPFPWHSILENLCMKVPSKDGLTGKLILKPKLFLLPVELQRNLFCILNFVFHLLPTSCIQLLAETVRTEHYVSEDWLLYLTRRFLRNSDHEICAQRTQVMERLQILCKCLNQTGAEQSKLGHYKQHWDSSQTDCIVHSESETSLEDDHGPSLNVCTELCITSRSLNSGEELKIEEVEAPKENMFIKVLLHPAIHLASIPTSARMFGASFDLKIECCTDKFSLGHLSNLKQIIYRDMDSEILDLEYLLKLKNICDMCNPLQLQTVFSSLGVAQVSPKCLFQLCTLLDSMSPDVSYAHAELLASMFFLDKVLSLSAPASRTLTAALAVFCRKYASPACNTLISPLLAKAETGSVHTDFLCRMISECLELHQLHLCFQPIFKVSCSEVSVSILHMLVDKQEKLNHSEFDCLLHHLNHSAENFSKSVAFSKLLLVLLTSKKNLVQPSHIGLLTNPVKTNQTFMKKSLQNALKKVQESF